MCTRRTKRAIPATTDTTRSSKWKLSLRKETLSSKSANPLTFGSTGDAFVTHS